ncbi:MAG: hypothetical protein CSA05_00470 [Bacteroidia bacterium]|nr:MAG: hypothetical protein CSB01_00240 [Bacteroidia bacterium]PIE86425.1 MAG: hypothetical protein CSA05_00470 [Bacteroidia bacterium]
MKKKKLCWFLGVLALITNLLGFIPLILVSQTKGEITHLPYHEHYNLIISILIPLCFLFYVLCVRCIVSYKNQAGIYKWLGIIGPMGLLGALLIPNRRKYLGKVKMEVPHEAKGMEKLLPKSVRRKHYKYVSPEEYEAIMNPPEEEKVIIENIEAETIEVKGTDGRIYYIKTATPKPEEEQKEENEEQSEENTSNTEEKEEEKKEKK